MEPTPGPWEIVNRPRGIEIVWRQQVGSAQHEGTICVLPDNRAYDKANARLIKAAPKLLKACELLLDCPDLNLEGLEPKTIEAMRVGMAAVGQVTSIRSE